MNTLKVLDLMEDKGAQADSRVKLGCVDLGLTANVRPSLLMSDYPAEDELALVLVLLRLSTNDHQLLC
jgi:hypothetical protein